MSSYIILELDTTPPIVNIYAPRYTTNDVANIITIESNENLSNYQEVYVIDSRGDRHDYTFQKVSPSSYVGEVVFSNLPIGVAEIYVRLQDDVGNLSNLASATFEIKTSLKTVAVQVKDLLATTAKVNHDYNIAVNTDEKQATVKVKDLLMEEK